MKIKKANDGTLTNFEVLNFLQSRGASNEVAVTVTPSEYKVFQYLADTPAGSQTRETIIEFVEKLKKYDLAKAEILNIIDTRPILPVIFAIVDRCDKRIGFTGAEEIRELVKTIFPSPPEEAEQEDEDVDAAETADGGDNQES